MSGKDIERLRNALKDIPEDVAKDALALSLMKQSNDPSGTVDMRSMESERIKDVFELFAHIKRTYTFAELDRFILEGGKLSFKDGDRRIVFAEKPVRPPSAEYRTNAQPRQDASTTIPQGNTEADRKDQGPSDGPERFRRLELDD